MLPCIVPGAVGEGIAYFVVGNGITVELRQQIAPFAVAISIGDGVGGRYAVQTVGGVGILFTTLNVARFIIDPGIGIAAGLVILPNKLIGAVVDIACGVCTVGDRQDIAIVVLGDAKGRFRPLGKISFCQDREPSPVVLGFWLDFHGVLHAQSSIAFKPM